MNTIPLTLEARKPTYTVIGGSRGRNCPEDFPVSILLLNRGSRLYRASLFQELTDIGFDSIISIETNPDSPELETLAARFHRVRFIVFKENISIGDQINVGMRESCAPYVFVLWNDLRLATSALSSRFFDRVVELDAACLVPYLGSASGEPMPSMMHPALDGQSLRIVPLPPRKDGEKSLFPFDLCGIYSRERFILGGGFDWTIPNPYWQRLDYGMRTWLWGERIVFAQALKLNYQNQPPALDLTPDESYGRFWLKNLAPRYRADSAYLPGIRFTRFLLRSRMNPFVAWREFNAARTWVRTTSFRFKQDAARLIDLWDPLS
ncbi:MAG: hypothetical protein E4H20_03655 [Spirochaetales bacterium]|nr:MAG: hypothetical protein E4H20_03655 [Spirochaetales bacterium]